MKKKQEGKTLANRLAWYFRKNNLPFEISLEQKREIGSLFAKKAFSNGHKHKLERKIIKEPEGEFEVIVWPPYLVRVMDAFIISYFKNNGIITTSPTNQKMKSMAHKRKRNHTTTKNTITKPPISKLLEFSSDCNGPFTIITDIIKTGEFEKLYMEWYDHPATTMWCAESFILYVKMKYPKSICVLKEDFNAITKGHFIPATKEEYEAENN